MYFIYKYYILKVRCSCSKDHFGEHCEPQKARFSLELHNETISPSIVRIIQLISHDTTKTRFTIEQQDLMSTHSERIFHNDFHLPSIGLLKVYQSSLSDIYLLYSGDNHSNISLAEQNKRKCIHAKEFNLIPRSYSHDDLLSTV